MKLTKEQVRDIVFDDSEEFEVVQDGDWISEGKYEFKSVVFKAPDGKHYEVGADRSGSYHTDWHYSFEYDGQTAFRVEEKEVTTTQWVAVAKEEAAPAAAPAAAPTKETN
jgi:hypothetical protein